MTENPSDRDSPNPADPTQSPEPTASPTGISSISSSERDPVEAGVTTELQFRQAVISGPIPPPEVLARYGDIDSTFPERILAMAERQSAHRQGLEKTTLNAQVSEATENRRIRRRGQAFAFIVALSFLGGALWVAYMDHPTVAGVIGGSTVVSLAVVFVTGRGRARSARAQPDQTGAQPVDGL